MSDYGDPDGFVFIGDIDEWNDGEYAQKLKEVQSVFGGKVSDIRVGPRVYDYGDGFNNKGAKDAANPDPACALGDSC